MHCRSRCTAALVTSLLAVACVYSVSAKQWSPQSFPNPLTDVNLCGRGGKKSWICDPDRILSESSQNVVEGTVRDIAVAKSPYGPSDCPDLPEGGAGYQVRAVTSLCSIHRKCPTQNHFQLPQTFLAVACVPD